MELNIVEWVKITLFTLKQCSFYVFWLWADCPECLSNIFLTLHDHNRKIIFQGWYACVFCVVGGISSEIQYNGKIKISHILS